MPRRPIVRPTRLQAHLRLSLPAELSRSERLDDLQRCVDLGQPDLELIFSERVVGFGLCVLAELGPADLSDVLKAYLSA